MNRWLMAAGLVLVMLGLLWPWLLKIPLGQLPGDFRYERNGVSLYFPFTTCLLISVVVSLLMWLFRR